VLNLPLHQGIPELTKSIKFSLSNQRLVSQSDNNKSKFIKLDRCNKK